MSSLGGKYPSVALILRRIGLLAAVCRRLARVMAPGVRTKRQTERERERERRALCETNKERKKERKTELDIVRLSQCEADGMRSGFKIIVAIFACRLTKSSSSRCLHSVPRSFPTEF